MSASDFDQDPALAALIAAELPLDDRAGPAPRITRDRAAALVEQALASMPAAPALPAEGKLAGSVAGGRAWMRVAAMAAAAVLMLTGGAALARYAYEQLFAKEAPVKEQTAVPPVQIPKQVAVQAPVPVLPPAAEAVPVSDSVSDSVSRSESGSDSVSGSRKEREVLAPDDLLQKANRLRSLGQFAEAAATYSQVYERDARSLSAYVAQVAAASIELEHLAHPARAKKLFERALRAHPGAALDLEARQGLALSLRDLGDAEGEAAALQALIERHPKSPAAKRAALRLGELGAE
jgi:tetratricopeptide (TPR) repeat protein